jgi:hypothetical protein
LQTAGHAIADEYADLADPLDGERRATPPLIELAKRAPDPLRSAGGESAGPMLVLATHFEGGGALDVLDRSTGQRRLSPHSADGKSFPTHEAAPAARSQSA